MTESQFNELAAAGHNRIPLVLETFADLDTPLSVYLKLANQPHTYLLESVVGGERFGRYSFIGLAAQARLEVRGHECTEYENGKPARTTTSDDPLQFVREYQARFKAASQPGLPRFCGGLVGLFGYDTVRLMEELPEPNPDPIRIPEAVLIRPTLIVVFDAVKDSITVITPVRPEKGVDPKAALDRAEERLSAVVDALDRPLDKAVATIDTGPLDVAPKSNTTPAEYRAMVLKAKEYILAGDIFQVVLSQRFEAPFKLPPFALYRALRRLNPSPFLFHLDFGEFAIVGSSPEILVRLREGTVTIRPIAGTRPRGATPAADKALAEELLSDPKEIAEHVMLIDLARNRQLMIGADGQGPGLTPIIQRYSDYFVDKGSVARPMIAADLLDGDLLP